MAGCSSFTEGQKPIQVTVYVDRILSNGSLDENFQVYHFMRNNGDDVDNFEFSKIEIPETGSFSLSVTVQGQVCYDCCSEGSCDSNGGRIQYRGISPTFSTGANPNKVSITPGKTKCS